MPIENLTPKQRFLKSKDRVEAHRFIISHQQFDHSIDTAMLQLQEDIERGGDIQNAAAKHFQMSGALQFVRILKNLSEIVDQPKTLQTPQLRHDA